MLYLILILADYSSRWRVEERISLFLQCAFTMHSFSIALEALLKGHSLEKSPSWRYFAKMLLERGRTTLPLRRVAQRSGRYWGFAHQRTRV